jgi:mannosyltransferase OCH1-like enzyme
MPTYRSKLEPQLYALIADKHIVQKTDLWRLIKLYIEGGLYMDIDRFVNTPLDGLVDEDTKWVVPTCRDYDFSHDFMMTSPQSPVPIAQWRHTALSTTVTGRA